MEQLFLSPFLVTVNFFIVSRIMTRIALRSTLQTDAMASHVLARPTARGRPPIWSRRGRNDASFAPKCRPGVGNDNYFHAALEPFSESVVMGLLLS